MIDINKLKQNPKEFKEAISKKTFKTDLDQLISLDEKRRELTTKVDELRAQRNQASQNRDIEKGKEIKASLDNLEADLKKADIEFKDAIYEIPNPPLPNVPIGDESNNQVLRTEGEIPKFSFTPKDHLDIGENLNIIDMVRASKVSGSRFAYLKNKGALLELALVQMTMQVLVEEGFSPIIPPTLIKQPITAKLGYWHGGGNENYYLVSDYLDDNPSSEKQLNQLYLVGTGEHAVVPMYMDEVFQAAELPAKFAAFSSCYRREAGTYGKDTKGILRVHQFDKVEMVEFVRPEDDEAQRRKMLAVSEKLLKMLGLPYQVVQLASGDLGFPAAETIDLETWIPSQNKYRETHSISTTTDFQARRLNIKFKNDNGDLEYVHILNGTAFAIGRTVIAILENFQQEDGSVIIPEALRKYTGFDKISP